MSDSMEPFIDNLWYYESVISPKSGHPLQHSEPERLPLSFGCQSSSLLPLDPACDDSPHMHDLHNVFDAIDENHDGKLSRSELCKWMKKLGLDFTEEGMIRMVSRADFDRTGSLDFKEFVSLNEAIDREGKNDYDDEEEDAGKHEEKSEGKLLHAFMLHQVFELFDRDHNGLISPEELSITLENLGLVKRVKEDESLYVNMIKHVDMDGDGQVNFAEFQKMMDNRSIDFHEENATRQ